MKEKSPLNSNSGRFIGTFTNIEFTDLFYIKTWLKDNPFQAMLLAVAVLLFSCSYMVYLAERTFPVDCDLDSGKFSTYFNSLWLIIITVFTVGYGDLTPQTDLGRGIAVVAALCGLMLSATLIGLVHQYLTLNNDESNVLKFIAEHQRIKVYQESALEVIM
jgi:voltage-gated potassium channel